ncbi:hypothetical protein KO488_05710 [Poseidonibacter lekithochrous]|uniref:hypothetical protein n=1 Tax=Poseidonibacter TaxID=2321187 RepID=UPI001C093AC1|nr:MULTISPECIES: hypothetical protein [Poseidonibacter]MBU3014246.1 hypothetical protein [Poseidonibacter lekithochrous]MDO6827543.1 hypothetical protein [Poseidonibacter sp. 1_MG-2023]
MKNNNHLKKLLRIEDEPFKLIDDLTVHNILTKDISQFMRNLKKFYNDWALDQSLITLPTKSIYSVDNIKGDFRIMPCIINKNEKIKAVKIIGTNEENNFIKDKISVGKMLLLDWYDNYIYVAIDACILSSFRTAAISVLAYTLYEYHKENAISIIGAGRIGFYTALILHKYLKINTLYCYDIKNTDNFIQLCKIHAPTLKIIIKDTSEEVFNSTNSVFLCTNSEKSILNKENSKNIEFISSIGADADNLSELDSSIVNDFQIITDSKQSLLLGDMKKWEKNNLIEKDDVLELRDLINEKPLNKKVLFISTGVALQDAITAKYVYDLYN